MIGQVLDNRYQITRRLGQGGFGIVYRARDNRLKRDVAVKVLSNAGTEAEARTRFMRECESMARLMHPNIVAVFDFGEHENHPYMVMELVDGITLLEALERVKPDHAEILRYGIQIASALTVAHELGIVHRDVTLKNVMLAASGETKVLDFGLVKILDVSRQSNSGTMVGTPLYLSPEQARGEVVDARADIFAFGVCLYRMLFGRYPFEAEHPAAVLYQIANEDPYPMTDEVPVTIRDVITRCLEKDRNKRYPDLREVKREISAIRAEHKGLTQAAATVSSLVRLTADRSSKRNPYLNRMMIKNPDDFFGRAREVMRIYSRLDAPHPQSMSIVGMHRTGKSSLLNYIYQRRNRRAHMQHYDNAMFVYMDFQRSGDMGVSGFINVLFEMFNYEQKAGFGAGSNNLTLDMLKDAVEKLDLEGKRIVILMDEFDVVTANPRFDMQFFSFLRFLANTYKVAYVTSSLSDLQMMCHNKEISDSPFFNIFSNLPLRPFSRDEAVQLISVPSAKEGVPLEPYADRIVSLAGHFPFYLQIACSSVFESVLERDGGEPDWEQVQKVFADEARPHFSFVWDRMDDVLKTNMGRLAAGKRIEKKFQHVPEELLRLGFVREVDGSEPVLFSDAFRDFVIEYTVSSGAGKSFFKSLFQRGGTVSP